MRKWTERELIEEGYTIENAIIKTPDLSMADHGVLTLSLPIHGRGFGVVIGGYVLGHGYVGADDFDGSDFGIECIERIMDVVGVDTFNSMKGKYIRIASKSFGSRVHIIGNIIENKWFDEESFFKDAVKEKEDESSASY